MEPIQIIGIIFVVFAYSRAILRFKDKQITSKEFLFWSIVWISVLVVAISPSITGWFSDWFGIGRPVDLIVYVSIIALFYLIFRLYVKIEGLDQNITKIVRNTAINKNKKK